MLRNFTNIKAYGCSYTAGDELLDAQILYKLGDEQTVDNLKRSFSNHGISKFRSEYYIDKYVDKEWFGNDGKFDWGKKIREEQKLSWVRHLADIFEVPYLNRGWGGASIEYCIYRYEEDLINGLISDDDLLIFCIPTPARFTFVGGHGELVNSLYNYPDTWVSHKLYEQMTTYFCNTYNIYWNYFNGLKYLELLFHSRGNVLVFFSNIEFENLKAHYLDKIDPNHPIDRMIDSVSNFSSIIKDGPNFVAKNNITHGFGHSKLQKHKDVANQLADHIRNLL